MSSEDIREFHVDTLEIVNATKFLDWIREKKVSFSIQHILDYMIEEQLTGWGSESYAKSRWPSTMEGMMTIILVLRFHTGHLL